jgi:hypothetical protein
VGYPQVTATKIAKKALAYRNTRAFGDMNKDAFLFIKRL